MKNEILNYILNHIEEHPTDIAVVTATQFNVSRQTVLNYLAKLGKDGLVVTSGKTKDRKYVLKNTVSRFNQRVVSDMAEDVLWRENMLPLLTDLNPNVLDICQYGFTEIVRNVIDHSESENILFAVNRNAICVELDVTDHGVGIFNKIQKYFNLNDSRHALLELAKGKLTTDAKRHSGEGIFFSSRMFDRFEILSKPLHYRRSKEGSEWLIDVGDSDQKGTFVRMEISPFSARTIQEVFDEFAPSKNNYGFNRTHVPIELARYEGEKLISRSQAKRLLTGFERFSEVLLDFSGVTMIGQAFADEIFRVYQQEHPSIQIFAVNANENVEKMIQRVKSNMQSVGLQESVNDETTTTSGSSVTVQLS